MPSQSHTANSKTNTNPDSAKIIHIEMVERSGRYRIGAPHRPDIKHDNGFLDVFPRRQPTAQDHVELAKWIAKLEAAEAFRPDLADATARN